MKRTHTCPDCQGTEIYTAVVVTAGGYEDLLPGAHPWWKNGKIEVYICVRCGRLAMYVPESALLAVRESKKFKRAR